MEYFVLPSSSTASNIACVFAVHLFLYCLLWISRNFRKKAMDPKIAAPEAAGAWPVIGHLHLLGGSQLPHRELGKMADKYGPIFTIKLGVHRTLVVSNPAMARECLTLNDKAFASRPKLVGSEQLGYNHAMFGFAPYGPYWRQARKTTTTHLLANHRLETIKHVYESEVKAFLKDIYQRCSKADAAEAGDSNPVVTEMRRWFADVTMQVLVRVVIGKQYFERYSANDGGTAAGDRFRKAFEEVFRLMGLLLVGDAIPYLRWLDVGGYEREMKKTAAELDRVMEEWIEEHKRKRVSAAEDGGDFMEVLLSLLDRDEDVFKLSHHQADNVIKSTCLGIILAGSDTTTVTLTWALSLLLNNPHILKKAQNELDSIVGKERQVKETDIKHLVYLQAIIKETMRLYPAGPLSVPHQSIEDCTVNGYHIPAGTRLLVNLWRIHRDPQVWSNPEEFQPERFLMTHRDVDVRGQHFELIPFSSGRRMCPGVSFALQVLHFTLANLLHGFDIATPGDQQVDMSECFGLTVTKAMPLEAILSPRLPSHLYI